MKAFVGLMLAGWCTGAQALVCISEDGVEWAIDQGIPHVAPPSINGYVGTLISYDGGNHRLVSQLDGVAVEVTIVLSKLDESMIAVSGQWQKLDCRQN